MTILDENKIDIVATRPGSPMVRLIVADHLEWDDFDYHARLIQAKVNAYLEFIESGEIWRTTAFDVPSKAVLSIELAVKHRPTDEASAFLAEVGRFLAGYQVGFAVTLREP